MDPRIYFLLPEHVSNAYSIWNCAWFLAQMSSLAESNTSSKQFGLLNSDENSTQKTENNTTNLSLLLENIIMNNSNDSILNDLKTNEYFKLNEPLMTLLKYKKRNKASLFNLILPSTQHQTTSSTTLSSSSCSSSCSSLTSSTSSIPVNNNKRENLKLLEIDKSTTPWLDLKSPETITNISTTDEPDTNSNDLNEVINFINDDSSNVNNDSSANDDQINNEDQDLLNDYDYNEGCKR